MKTYSIIQIMTIAEAAEKYGVPQDTLRNKFKKSVTGTARIEKWVSEGLVRQSGSTWLLTDDFMKSYMLFKN